MSFLIVEGIRKDGDNIIFDFTQDFKDDIIPLKFQRFNKKLSTRFGTNIYFGYRYNEGHGEDLTFVRDAIKYLDFSKINENDLKLMIQKAANNFVKVNGNKIDLIITPKSSGKLVNYIAKIFKEKLGGNVLLATDVLVKNTVNNIKIDPQKIDKLNDQQRKNVINAIRSATKTGSFKMKSIPIPMRRLIIDFMTFSNDTTRQIYNSLSGNILLLDDIYTGGSTFNEMSRIINEYEPQSLTGFVLLLSK